jgi:signal peptidase I
MGNESSAGELDGHRSAGAVPQGQADAAQTKAEGGLSGGEESSALKEWVELLVRAGFWALLIYLLVFQVSVVDGPSMQPNFEFYDRLVIDKLTYHFSPVKRFDVIVFEAIDYDRQPRQSRDYIKRVVGLPGEKVTIRNQQLFVDGNKVAEPFKTRSYVNLDTNPNPPEAGPYGVTIVVPPKHFFVMGDNRGSSHDSRSAGLAFVPESQIKGLVRIRWWPWSRLAWFSRVQ